MMKKTLFAHDTHKKQLQGVKNVYDAVKVTLGPSGSNVTIAKKNQTPIITKDGVSIVKEIEMQDHACNMGVNLVKEVASNTATVAGDGTTTSAVLTYGILSAGARYRAAGVSALKIKKGIDLAASKVIEYIESVKHECNTPSSIRQIATISANNNEEIGNMIAEAIEKVGNDGSIAVADGNSFYDQLEVVEGMQLDNGYLSPHFIKPNADSNCEEFNEAHILITDKNITSLREIIPILEHVSTIGKPLLIVAENVDKEALSGLILNNMRGSIKVIAVKAPGFGDMRREILEDLAVLTGATVISDATNKTFESEKNTCLGKATKIKITKDNTTIIGGAGHRASIDTKVQILKKTLDTSTSTFDAKKIEERIAKLSKGVALIKVGGDNEVAMKERKDRIEDALSATQAAIQEGYVAGGGVALFNAKKKLLDLAISDKEIQAGIDVMKEALELPIRIIVSNAGGAADVVLNKLRKSDDHNFGYDALKHQYCDMIVDGVIDPVKVTKSAIRNASSIAGLMLNTNASIVEYDNHKDTTENDLGI